MFNARLSRALLATTIVFSTSGALAAPEDGAKFKDWTISCEEATQDGNTLRVCNLNQGIAAGDPPRPLLRVAVTFVPQDDKPYMVITMPLGMALPPGVQLQIDDGEKVVIPVNTCLPDGCRAGGVVADDMLTALKKGNQLKVSFADMKLKGITIPMSLSGFTAGLAALK